MKETTHAFNLGCVCRVVYRGKVRTAKVRWTGVFEDLNGVIPSGG